MKHALDQVSRGTTRVSSAICLCFGSTSLSGTKQSQIEEAGDGFLPKLEELAATVAFPSPPLSPG